MTSQNDITLGMATKLVYKEWVEHKLHPVEDSNSFEKDVIRTYYLFKRIQSRVNGSNSASGGGSK